MVMYRPGREWKAVKEESDAALNALQQARLKLKRAIPQN